MEGRWRFVGDLDVTGNFVSCSSCCVSRAVLFDRLERDLGDRFGDNDDADNDDDDTGSGSSRGNLGNGLGVLVVEVKFMRIGLCSSLRRGLMR